MYFCCILRRKVEPEEIIAKNHLSKQSGRPPSFDSKSQLNSDKPIPRTFAELAKPNPVAIARPNNKSDEDITVKK
jgi:hypothetical protein